MGEVWASGDAYEPYAGRWSRLVAPEFLDWLAAPPRNRWLDVGCGTGALTTAILDRCDPATVVGLDSSEGYVTWAAAHVQDPRARRALHASCPTRRSQTERPSGVITLMA